MGEPVDRTADVPVAAETGEHAAPAAVSPSAPAPASTPGPTPDPTSAPAAATVGDLDPQRALDGLAERPLSEHAEVFEELHAHLQRTLAEIDGG